MKNLKCLLYRNIADDVLFPKHFMWIIFIRFRDTNEFENLAICKHELKFTCCGYCRFTKSSVSRNVYSTRKQLDDFPSLSNLGIGCVFYYWMCRSDVSVIPFRMCRFLSIIAFDLVVMDFLPFLACGR